MTMATPGSFLTPREQRKYQSQLASLTGLLEPDEPVSLASTAELWTATTRLHGVAALTDRRLLLSLTRGEHLVLLRAYGYHQLRAIKVDGGGATLLHEGLVLALSRDISRQLGARVADAGGHVLGKA